MIELILLGHPSKWLLGLLPSSSKTLHIAGENCPPSSQLGVFNIAEKIIQLRECTGHVFAWAQSSRLRSPTLLTHWNCSPTSWGFLLELQSMQMPGNWALSLTTVFSIDSHFVNSHLVNVDEVGIDKVRSWRSGNWRSEIDEVGIDEMGIDEMGRHPHQDNAKLLGFKVPNTLGKWKLPGFQSCSVSYIYSLLSCTMWFSVHAVICCVGAWKALMHALLGCGDGSWSSRINVSSSGRKLVCRKG